MQHQPRLHNLREQKQMLGGGSSYQSPASPAPAPAPAAIPDPTNQVGDKNLANQNSLTQAQQKAAAGQTNTPDILTDTTSSAANSQQAAKKALLGD